MAPPNAKEAGASEVFSWEEAGPDSADASLTIAVYVMLHHPADFRAHYLKGVLKEAVTEGPELAMPLRRPPSTGHQFKVLLRRELLLLWRDRLRVVLMLLAAVVLSRIVAGISSATMQISLVFSWTAMLSMLTHIWSFSSLRLVWYREASGGISQPAFFLAKAVWAELLSLVLTAAFAVPFHATAIHTAPFGLVFLVIWVNVVFYATFARLGSVMLAQPAVVVLMAGAVGILVFNGSIFKLGQNVGLFTLVCRFEPSRWGFEMIQVWRGEGTTAGLRRRIQKEWDYFENGWVFEEFRTEEGRVLLRPDLWWLYPLSSAVVMYALFTLAFMLHDRGRKR